METATETNPTIRVRIQHSNTIKEGWRLAETTVEYTGETIDWKRVKDELHQAFMVAQIEALERQQFERTGAV